MCGLRHVALIAVGALLPAAAATAAEPCGQTPKSGGDAAALARATAVGDADHRLEALRALAALLAVNRTVPVSVWIDVDWGRPQVVPRVPLRPPVVGALATRLVDPDAAVRACATEAVQADLFSFQAPVRPAIKWNLPPELGAQLVRSVEPASAATRKVVVEVLMAADRDVDHDGATWEKLAAEASPATILLIASEVFDLLPTDREFEPLWNDAARSALNGLFRAAAQAGHLDAVFALADMPRKRTPDRGWLELDLRQGLELAARGGHLGPAGERQLVAHLQETDSGHDLALMGEVRDPQVQREAASYLVGILKGPEHGRADDAAAALVALPDPQVQALALALFAELLASDNPNVLHGVARALPGLTDPAVPERMANLLVRAIRRCSDARAGRALLVALGRIAWGEQTVQILTEFYRNSPSPMRGPVAAAFAAIPDGKLQEPALPLVIALLDDPLASNQIAAALALGQFKTSAAQAHARAALENFQVKLRRKLGAKQRRSDQRITFAACALEQLTAKRPATQPCATAD
jgi:hypothetical protein